MSERPTGAPVLDGRSSEEITRRIRDRLPGYEPRWRPGESGPGSALLQAAARVLRAVGERLDRAPDKNKLAALDLLGIDLLPARAARVPVAFETPKNVGDGTAPQRTRVGATVAGHDGPVVFETEYAIGLAAARLAEVVTVIPGRDAAEDHSEAVVRGQPVTLFGAPKRVEHILYLAHDVRFALAGRATVELNVELGMPGAASLPIAWEYWDGEVWRAFKPFRPPGAADEDDGLDGTLGLTRSGVIRLVADCADTKPTTVNGVKGSWIRGLLTEPLGPGTDPPVVDRIGVRTVIRREGWSQSLRRLGTAANPVVGGRVTDFTGAPLAGVQVRGEGLAIQTTDANGRYSLPPVQRNRILRFTVSGANLPTYAGVANVEDASLELDLVLNPGLKPDQAFADGLKLDTSKSFAPLGQQPQPGSAFYFASEEAFSKPGAEVTFFSAVPAAVPTPTGATAVTPVLVAEYWNGTTWRSLGLSTVSLAQFLTAGSPIAFEVPADVTASDVNGVTGRWCRIRIVERTFARTRTVTWTDSGANPPRTNSIDIVETTPPVLTDFRFGYVYRSPQDAPQACLAFNDFRWADHSEAVRWRGGTFRPYVAVEDPTPALYLGFDRPLPADLIGLYLDFEEVPGDERGPALRWEHWDGTAWLPLGVEDETANLAVPGMVRILWPGIPEPPSASALRASGNEIELVDAMEAARFAPDDLLYVSEGDKGELATLDRVSKATLTLRTPLQGSYARATVAIASLPRFGTPRTWIRARLESDGEPRRSKVRGIFANAVWAEQIQTFDGEVLGSSSEQPNQAFFFRNTPVVGPAIVEVRELDGPRAEVELPILQRELARLGIPEDALRTVTDRRTRRVTEVWVRWRERPHLFFSSPSDRHYMLERSRGRLIFGDGVRGRIPPAGPDNVRARAYRSGGGTMGNVAAGAASQLLGGALAQGVSNPRAAEGGADGEPAVAVLARGPLAVRHRRQAITPEDYEALAREASPAVAVARALPNTDPAGRPAPGWTRVLIAPTSAEPQPRPSLELRRQVRAFLDARAPASIAGRISVGPPDYLPIGVEARIAPVDPSAGRAVVEATTARLSGFLHPLTGGPEGTGWAWGRDVFLSDVASVIERTPGVDYVETLNLLLAGTPSGERIEVPADRLVVRGPLRISLVRGEA